MSAWFVAFLAAIGTSVWAYTKLQNKTGYGNSRSAVTAAAVVFVIVFLVVFTVFHMIAH